MRCFALFGVTRYVDAVVFGYLAIILHADASEPALVNLLQKNAPNLVQWVERLEKKYFANEATRQAKLTSDQGLREWLTAQSVRPASPHLRIPARISTSPHLHIPARISTDVTISTPLRQQ